MNKKKIILIAVLLSIFFLIMTLVLLDKIGSFDSMMYEAVRSLESNFFDSYFTFITRFGDTSVIVCLVIILMIVFRNFDGLVLGILASGSSLTNFIIKNIVGRERPNVLKLIEEGGYSFPSGHSTIAVSVYGFLLYLVLRKIKNKYLKVGLSSLLVLLIISIGVSRIYVGVHFASDVLAGFALSLAEVLFATLVFDKWVRGN